MRYPRSIPVVPWALLLAAACASPEAELHLTIPGSDRDTSGGTGVVDFGVLAPGAAAVRTITLFNRGPGPVSVETPVAGDGEVATQEPGRGFFVPESAPFALEAGEFRALRLVYTGALRTQSDEARVRWGLGGSRVGTLEVALRGRTELESCALNDSMTFGLVQVGQAEELTLLVGNNEPRLTRVRVAGVEGQGFELVDPALARVERSLSPGGTVGVGVRFVPGRAGDFEGTLRLRPGTYCPEQEVRLSGQAVSRLLQPGAPELDFGLVPVGRARELTLELANLTPRPVHLTQLSPRGGTDVFDIVAPAIGREGVATIPAATAEGPGSLTLTVRFGPRVLGVAGSALYAVTDLPSTPMLRLPLLGHGGGPRFQGPEALDFGPVAFLAAPARTPPVTRSWRVRNIGAAVGLDEATRLVLEAAGRPVRVEALNPATTVEELCVGTLDAQGGCLPELPPEVRAGVPLNSGAAVGLRLLPSSAGDKEWRLTFSTNDFDRPQAQVLVRAQVRARQPCSVALSTTSLELGQLLPRAPRRHGLTLRNTSAVPCLVSALELAPGGDPQFLPAAPASFEVAAGATVALDVDFRGQRVARTAAGLTFTVSAEDGWRRVTLAAQVQEACLLASRPQADLGQVRPGCPSAGELVELTNACDFPVELGAISASAPFEVTGTPALPLKLLPHASTSVSVRRGGAGGAVDRGALTVSSSEAAPMHRLVVPLASVAASGPNAQETLVWPRAVRVGLLVHHGSWMREAQERLASAAERFWAGAELGPGADARVLVATAEGTGLVRTTSAGGLLSAASASREGDLAALVRAGTMGPDWFRGLSSLASLIRSRSSFEVAQWLEADGPLSVLFLAGADDTSAVPHGTALQLLRQFRPEDPSQVQLLAIAGEVGELECSELLDTSTLAQAVSAGAGSLASICSVEREWGTLVGQMGQRAFRPARRELVGRPASGAAVELLLNGSPPPVGWRYEAASNSLSFAGLDWPRPGDTVTARYRLGCQ